MRLGVIPQVAVALVCAQVALPSQAAPAGPANKHHRKHAHGHPPPHHGNSGSTGTPAVKPPHLNYYGGRVISNVKIVPVFWTANIDAEVKSKIGTFYADFVASPAIDWLSEYDTSIRAVGGAAGTGQHIGRGTAVAPVVITPAQRGAPLNDTQIQRELQAQIRAHKLPASDANTIYMVHFPKGQKIKSGSGLSCQAFCAYHGTMGTPASSIYYGVLPDGSAGSGCDVGCGSGTPLGNLTASAAHEIVEAITDAQVGIARGNAISAPIAWYDPDKDATGQQYAEIGDICAAYEAPLTVNGRTWTIQKEWSNKHNGCIAVATDTPQVITASATATSQGSGSKRHNDGSASSRSTSKKISKKAAAHH